jgi:hypothetical protein
MRRRHAQREHVRELEWTFPGYKLTIELHQVDVSAWRADERLRGPGWHAVPSREPGRLIVARATLRPKA